MAARHRKGGKVKPGVPGMDVMKEAVAPAHGFKAGGATGGLKSGGVAHGDKAPPNMGKIPRRASGGAATMQGRSPYSAARKISSPSGIKENG